MKCLGLNSALPNGTYKLDDYYQMMVTKSGEAMTFLAAMFQLSLCLIICTNYSLEVDDQNIMQLFSFQVIILQRSSLCRVVSTGLARH